MRESFGGAFMIKLVLVFIVIYISFMSVAISYAKAFRVKNGIINILEQYQYSEDTEEVALTQIASYLGNIPYNITNVKKSYCSNGEFITAQRVSDPSVTNAGGGYCLEKKGTIDGKAYYKITTYIQIDFPFFEISMTVPISGETKTIIT